MQTSQAVQTLNVLADPSHPKMVVKTLGFIETVQNILAKDGAGAFWRGIGPAMVLVINPVLQYTVFEQLKNILVKKRTAKLRATGFAAVAVLSDWDFFFLGALSKLGMKIHSSHLPIVKLYPSRHCHHVSLYVCHLVLSHSNSISRIFLISVVKSRLQAGHTNALKYKSSLDGLLTILKEEGINGLYKGVGSKLVQSVLTAAILFAGQRRIYELTKAVGIYM